MNSPIKLIVGLGNPDAEHEHTLHNVGFDVIDVLKDELKCSFCKDECGAKTYHTCIDGIDVVLAMPQSYMNTSGGPVKDLMKKYEIKPDDLIVIHDDLDLPPGKLRIKCGGGNGGHNGIKSIVDKLGSSNFTRIKVGIGRPLFNKSVTEWVLSRPLKVIGDDISKGIELAAEATQFLISNDLETTQQKFN